MSDQDGRLDAVERLGDRVRPKTNRHFLPRELPSLRRLPRLLPADVRAMTTGFDADRLEVTVTSRPTLNFYVTGFRTNQ